MDQGVDGPILVSLDEDDLLCLPIHDSVHRKILLAEIEKRKKVPPSVVALSRESKSISQVDEWLKENASFFWSHISIIYVCIHADLFMK